MLNVAKWPLLLLLATVVFITSCSKEARKVDKNDGTENPIERKLIVEVTHRYNNYEDSVLPGAVIAFYESFDDEQSERYYRRDTTDFNGEIIFNNMAAGEFRVVMTHKDFGQKKFMIDVPVDAVAGYEYYYF